MLNNARLDSRHDGPDGPPDRAPDHALRVLVVDDDADTSDTMSILLEHWGFKALSVRNGSEALQANEAHSPDLILLDIGMPGMDGLEFARRLRGQAPPNGKTPFLIAVSGYGDAQTCHRSREAGIDLHLVKPVDPAHLEQLLRRFQRVVMPGAERKLHRSHRRLRLVPTLRHWSERGMVRQSLGSAREILRTGSELLPRVQKAQDWQERIRFREEWCEQSARLLDEAERIRCLLASFQRWGIHSTTDV